jgi:Outer membrane receptor proteins, mostly Fe transport
LINKTLLLSLAFISTSAYAAESPYLESVTVVATRNDASINALAQSVSIVDETSLHTTNAHHPSQIFQHTPGAWISRGNGQEHLTAIRSPVFTGAGACAAFLMSEDGIPLRPSGFCNVNQLFDTHYEVASQIEILRGPGSAVNGSNALFGSINTRLPHPLDITHSTFSAELSAHDYYRLKFVQPVLKRDHSALVVLGSATHDGGARQSSGYSQGKVSLKHHTETDSFSATSGVTLTSLDQETAGYIYGEDAYKDSTLVTTNPTPDAWRKNQTVRAWSKLNWDIDYGQLSLTPYARKTDTHFLMHFVPWQPEENNDTRSLGMQALWHAPTDETFDLTVGSDLELANGYLTEFQHQPSPFATDRIPQGAHYDYEVSAKNTAVFAHGNWYWANRFATKLRIRHDFIAYDYTNNLSSGSACTQAGLSCRFYRPEDRYDNFSFNSVSFGQHYSFNPHHNSYLTISRGFRAPQASELYRLQQGQNSASLLLPVVLTNIELGIRGSGQNYYYQFSVFNMFMNHGIFMDSQRRNVSGAETRHKGIEYELGHSFSHGIKVRIAGSFADHRYDNNPDLLGTEIGIEDNLIDTAPQNMHALKLDWQATERFTAQFEASHMGRYYLDPENSFSYPGHNIANIRLQYSTVKHMTFGLNILNMFNNAYAERADVSFGEYRYFPGEGRKAALSIEVSI